MSYFARRFFEFLLAFSLFILSQCLYAYDSLPKALISLENPAGMALFKKNMGLFPIKLLSNFETQNNVTYCGIATIAMILNSSGIQAPSDESHPSYFHFTQDNIFNSIAMKGISQDNVKKDGITLEQMRNIFSVYSQDISVYYANEMNLDKFRSVISSALSRGSYVVVNFSRADLGQKGGGHHSPIAIFDKASDRFLLLDVARYKYPPYWVRAEDLWHAVNTRDSTKFRGVLVVDFGKN